MEGRATAIKFLYRKLKFVRDTERTPYMEVVSIFDPLYFHQKPPCAATPSIFTLSPAEI